MRKNNRWATSLTILLGLSLVIALGVVSHAAEDSSLYESEDLSPPSGTKSCIAIEAQIAAVRMRDPDFPSSDAERAKAKRDLEIMRDLPPVQLAARIVIGAIQEQLKKTRLILQQQGHTTTPDCLKTLDLAKQALIVVTMALTEQYTCNEKACSLPANATYAVCTQSGCRARPVGFVGVSLSPEVFDPGKTLLQGLAEQTVTGAFSRLKF